jgi:cold shock protein
MPKGTVKWFNPTKGYGFIQPTGGGRDVFVHISAVERAGFSILNEGQAVEYEEVSNRGPRQRRTFAISPRGCSPDAQLGWHKTSAGPCSGSDRDWR